MAALGKGRGRLFIQPGVKFSQKMKDSFSDDTPDHRILAVTEYISEKMKGQKVILVTKDMNLRMKARSLGLQAEDYKTDQVEDLDDNQQVYLLDLIQFLLNWLANHILACDKKIGEYMRENHISE